MPKQQNISDSLNEIIGYVPNWITRYGALISFNTIIVMFIIMSVVKHPEIRTGSGYVSHPAGPVKINAVQSGALHLLKANGESIEKTEHIAFLGRNQDYEAFQALKKILVKTHEKVEYPMLDEFNPFYIQVEKLKGKEQNPRDKEVLTEKLVAWEADHLITAPISGQLIYLNFLTNGCSVEEQQELFMIVDPKNNDLEGKIYVPIAAAGKVNKGQKVTLLPEGQQVVNSEIVGVVQEISLYPTKSPEEVPSYFMTVALRNIEDLNDLSRLQFQPVKANIYVDERSLLEKIFLYQNK